MKPTFVVAALATAKAAYAQQPNPEVQSTSWNSSFKFSQDEIELGQLSPDLAHSLEVILNFDRSQLANGGPSQDGFYKLKGTSYQRPTSPGQVIRVEHVTNPTVYNIPAKTALSRILYSTTNLNGTLIPASAYILWPYTPKDFGPHSKRNSATKAPIVLWNHGTSGFYADGAPSAHRSLFYGDLVPFTLAQAGYAVVAPDYAGLGIETSWDGSFVPHQYLNHQANAGDSLNAIRAVRRAFPGKLTDEFVTMGHSQGANVAWGISEVLSQHPQKFKDVQKDHLGTVVFSPGSNAIYQGPQLFLPWIGKYLSGIYPAFKLSHWLSPLGIARTKLLDQVQGGQFFSQVLFLANATQMLNPAWNESWYAQAVTKASNVGNGPYKGPMIIFDGTNDQGGQYPGNLALFRATCAKYRGALEFVTVPGAGHFPVIDASRGQWLDWIKDRFEGKALASKPCSESTLSSFLPVEQYQATTRSFFQWSGSPANFYQLPVGSS
jgi:pimeloyl-ACP methyl ester carboxylesterase